MKRLSTFDMKTRGYPLSTKWLRFHTYWRLPAGAVINALVLLAGLASIFETVESGEDATYVCLGFVFDLFIYVNILMALFKTRRLDRSAYETNMTLFVSEIVCNVFMLLGSLVFGGIYSFVVSTSSSVGPIILAICNIVYFRKRKSLFFCEAG